MNLVIVESPAKAKTIAKYLGDGYAVDASGGHIRDLPKKGLGVDVKNGFMPTYEVSDSKAETVKRLTAKVKKAEKVYLATDPDREGEAISWHLQNVLALDENEHNRIVFNEITKKAVNEAIKQPRAVDMDLVNAQQARRVLDRLVGYKLSPVLCRKIKPSLSAGRVQSAALKIIVEKEREIRKFVVEEYWVITAFLFKEEKKELIFKATLVEKNGKKLRITDAEMCKDILSAIKRGEFIVKSVKRAKSYSKPQPPFTTSTLQQDAGTKLGLSSKMTMQIAQQLYEGVELPGEGHTALVTYIRTDSVRIAEEAQVAARNYLTEKYGKEYVPQRYNIYKSKKDSQDAHEAIRPINLDKTPDSLANKISRDQLRVYKLIYERFLASQSTQAVFDTLTVMTNNGEYGFKSAGKTLVFDGYLRIYGETKTSKDNSDDADNVKMPSLDEGEKVEVGSIKDERKETKPPARYTESTLVKTMEDNGIGRPSTYATIMSTLYARKYVELDKKCLVPTELGFTVTEYLEKYFNDIVDAEFTANMESKLDSVEEKGEDWRKIIEAFYGPFIKKVNDVSKNSEKVDMPVEMSDEICEKCGKPMIIKEGRFGKYLACSGYPECSNIKSLKKKEEVVTDIKCEKCGKPMIEKVGRYGKYLACSGYPECKNIMSLQKKVEAVVTDVKCEKCGKPMVEREGRYGKYLACSGYPECKNIISLKKTEKAEPDTKKEKDKVVDNNSSVLSGEVCEKCGKPMVEKVGRYGKYLACSNYPECKFTKSMSKPVCKCPQCKTGDIIEKKTGNGKIFYGCTNYPECKFASWEIPAPFYCPQCGAVMHVDKASGKEYVCSNTECLHKVGINEKS